MIKAPDSQGAESISLNWSKTSLQQNFKFIFKGLNLHLKNEERIEKCRVWQGCGAYDHGIITFLQSNTEQLWETRRRDVSQTAGKLEENKDIWSLEEGIRKERFFLHEDPL